MIVKIVIAVMWVFKKHVQYKYNMAFYTINPLVVFLIFFELLSLNYFSTGHVDFPLERF